MLTINLSLSTFLAELATCFTKTVLEFIQKIIVDEESLMPNPENWMLREANKHQVLLNYATFQASLFSCIEEKIAGCWARFFSFIDRNDNLLLLEDDENLWIDLLNNVMKTLDHSKDEERNNENHHGFSSKFPFSSFIIKDISEQLENDLNFKKG